MKHLTIAGLFLSLISSYAQAGQVSGGGPIAAKEAEQYILSNVDFQALRSQLKQLNPDGTKESETDILVLTDESGNIVLVKKAPAESSEAPSQ